MCNQQSLRSACAYAKSDQSICWLHEYSMNIKLLTEHHLEFLSLTGGCTGWSESTLVKIPHCWKSHVAAQLLSSDIEIVDSYFNRLRVRISSRPDDHHLHEICDVLQAEYENMCGSRGGDRGSGLPPPPPEKLQNIGFLNHTGPDPLKESQIYQSSIQCWAIIGPPAKRHLNGISLAGH